MLLSISLAPSLNYIGLTQALTRYLSIDIDPWTDYEGDHISKEDLEKISRLTNESMFIKGDFISWITNQAAYIVRYYLYKADLLDIKILNHSKINVNLNYFITEEVDDSTIKRLTNDIIPSNVPL